MLPPLPDLVSSNTDDDDETTMSEAETNSSEDEADFSIAPPPTLTSVRALDTASKVLFRDLLAFSSSPRVVDLSAFNSRSASKPTPTENGSADPTKPAKKWVPQKKTPQHQLWERSMEAEKLQERLIGLTERTSRVAQSRALRPRTRIGTRLG